MLPPYLPVDVPLPQVQAVRAPQQPRHHLPVRPQRALAAQVAWQWGRAGVAVGRRRSGNGAGQEWQSGRAGVEMGQGGCGGGAAAGINTACAFLGRGAQDRSIGRGAPLAGHGASRTRSARNVRSVQSAASPSCNPPLERCRSGPLAAVARQPAGKESGAARPSPAQRPTAHPACAPLPK